MLRIPVRDGDSYDIDDVVGVIRPAKSVRNISVYLQTQKQNDLSNSVHDIVNWAVKLLSPDPLPHIAQNCPSVS